MNYPTPHINAKPEDFAKTVLMPGDPLRAKFVAENYGFNIINCVKDGKLRTIEDIQNEIRKIVDEI